MAVAFGRVWKHAVVLLALLILLSTLEHGWLAGGHSHVVLSVLIGLPLLQESRQKLQGIDLSIIFIFIIQ